MHSRSVFSTFLSCFLLVVPFLLNPTSTLAGDRIGNGGGQGEQTIINTWSVLDHFVSYCLTDNFCQLSDKEKSTLNQIQKVMSEERKLNSSNLFVFTTAEQMKDPQFFVIDGQVKMAKTGDKVGSPIYFNLDLLNTRRSKKVVESLSLTDAVSILIHEVGHHTGEGDHTYLGSVGAKVAGVASKHIEEARLFPHSDDVKLTVINPNGNRGFPLVLLQGVGKTINLTERLREELKCSADLDSIWVKRKPLGAKLFNLYWPLKELHFKEKSDLKLALKGNLALFCDPDEKVWKYQKNHMIKIKLKLNYEEDEDNEDKKYWELDEDEIKVKQRLIPWWFLFNLPALVGRSWP